MLVQEEILIIINWFRVLFVFIRECVYKGVCINMYYLELI